MSLQRSVTIIGGGIAGLSAAVFLGEKDLKVRLLESSPKLGGRAYSFLDKEKKLFSQKVYTTHTSFSSGSCRSIISVGMRQIKRKQFSSTI